MTEGESRNLALVREYLAALAVGETGASLARFFTADAEQVEHPNRLNPQGGRSDLAKLLARSEQGKRLLRSQRYDILGAVARDAQVAVEADWHGELAVAVAGLPEGGVMKAHFAMFFTMVDGRIRSQRNFDCFEPW